MDIESLSLPNEQWKPIIGYEGIYEISDLGRIKCLDRTWVAGRGRKRMKNGHIMKQMFHGEYLGLTLTKDGQEINFKVHRLIAQHFILNNDSKPMVNHKNGIKVDNRALNLEWCTNSENQKHAFLIGLKSGKIGGDNGNSKLVLDMQTGIYYDAMSEAAKAKGYSYKWCSSQLNNKNNKTSLMYV